MHRREFLAGTITVFGTSSLAGCSGLQTLSDDGETSSQSTPNTTATQTPSTATPKTDTPTSTPVPFPESCEPLPDIDGLPARPAELTEDSVISYLTEFERVYTVATKSSYQGIASLRVTHTETVGDRYNVQLEVEGIPVTPTPGPDSQTPTPGPADGFAHRVLYRLEDNRMLRELRGYAGGSRLSSDCWIVPPPAN